MACCKRVTCGPCGPNCCPSRPKDPTFYHRFPMRVSHIDGIIKPCPIHGNPYKSLQTQAQLLTSPFDKYPCIHKHISGIPICNNLAFFDHPPACTCDTQKKPEACREFVVDTRSLKVKNSNNNKDLENENIDLYFLTEESEIDDDMKSHINSRKPPWLNNETGTFAKNILGPNSYNWDFNSDDNIRVEIKQPHHPLQNTQDVRKTNQLGTDDKVNRYDKSVGLCDSTQKSDEKLLKDWIESLRVTETIESRPHAKCKDQKNNTSTTHEKRLCGQHLPKTNRTFTKRNETYSNLHHKRSNRPIGVPEGMSLNANPVVSSKSKLFSSSVYPLLNVYGKKNEDYLQTMEYNRPSGDQVMSGLEYDNLNNFRNQSPRHRRSKRIRENFIRKNILKVKSYQKQIGIALNPKMHRSQIYNISAKNGQVKSCPDNLCKNTETALDDSYFVNVNIEHKTTEQSLCETVKSTVCQDRDCQKEDTQHKDSFAFNSRIPQSSTEKAVVVNPKTGSVKSITFEIDDSEGRDISSKGGDLRLPVISLKSGSNTSQDCKFAPNSIDSINEQVQKDIFQIKGFVYETIGNDKETLYISYKNLKKLICSYSKKLNLKKSDESISSEMTLILRDKLGRESAIEKTNTQPE